MPCCTPSAPRTPPRTTCPGPSPPSSTSPPASVPRSTTPTLSWPDAHPLNRSTLAATATELCHAVGAAGRAVSALAAAQDARLFIGHFSDRYGHPDVDSAFARARIAAALTTARDNLTETSGYLRHLSGTDPAVQLLRAARARSRQADGAAMGSAAVSPAESSTPIPPNPARRR